MPTLSEIVKNHWVSKPCIRDSKRDNDVQNSLLDSVGEGEGGIERLLLNHGKIPGFLAPGGEEFNLRPEMRLDRSELLCNKVLLKYKGDRESF